MKLRAITLSIFMLVAWEVPGVSHPGGLNAQGCHNNRKTGDYHCHRGNSTPKPAPKPRKLYSAPRTTAFANCAAARAEGAAPVRRGDPGYGTHLDGDGDGIGCESSSRNASSAPRSVSSSTVVPLMAASNARPGDSKNVIIGVATALDGDTIAINSQRIRLYGIDAFEADQTCEGNNKQRWGCGGVATRSLQEALQGRTTICFPKDTDAYGRIVAICRTEGTDLSALQAVRGLAIAYRKYAKDYVPDETVAQSAKVGGWYGTFTEPETHRRTGAGKSIASASRTSIDNTQCNIKGNITSSGRRLYHLPGDPNYAVTRQEVIFCSMVEAEAAGFGRPIGLQQTSDQGVSVQ